METIISWQRQNVISSLPPRSYHLVQRYAQKRGLLPPLPAPETILERVQAVVTAAASANHGSAEYRCLETGAFLDPTVLRHPWYKQHRTQRRYSVLDLGCGLGADGRQMLVDGFAKTVLGIDRSDVYLRLGCDLFGERADDCLWNEESNTKPLPSVAFVAMDVVDDSSGGSDDAMITLIRTILSRQQQPQQPENPLFDAVYAGKFLHCLETETNLRTLLRRLGKLMRPGGVFFGVFGRNCKPAFECSSQQDFVRVFNEEGYSMEMILEEAAGATWFCAMLHAGNNSEM